MYGDADRDRRFDLLVLDYGGVCTPSHREYLAADRDGIDIEHIRPECRDLVRQVSDAGISVVILSNEIDATAAGRSELPEGIDHVIACTDNGILKPDRRAFQRALLVGGCEPGRTLVVDDDDDNVRSARLLGIEAVEFDVDDPVGSWRRVAAAVGVSPPAALA